MTRNPSAGRLKLVAIALVFLGPLAAAFALYYLGDGWRPAATTEHGVLLAPVTLPDDPLTVLENGGIVRFRSRWSVVHIGGGACGPVCRKALYRTRQVRRSMGRDAARLQRIFVVRDGAPDEAFFADEHPDLAVATGDSPGHRALLSAVGETGQGDIYLVDPIGNLMMRFPRDTEMKDIKKDLVRLLRLSRIG